VEDVKEMTRNAGRLEVDFHVQLTLTEMIFMFS
jgi:hypothetical protein